MAHDPELEAVLARSAEVVGQAHTLAAELNKLAEAMQSHPLTSPRTRVTDQEVPRE